jgi:hypothetical protein
MLSASSTVSRSMTERIPTSSAAGLEPGTGKARPTKRWQRIRLGAAVVVMRWACPVDRGLVAGVREVGTGGALRDQERRKARGVGWPPSWALCPSVHLCMNINRKYLHFLEE